MLKNIVTVGRQSQELCGKYFTRIHPHGKHPHSVSQTFHNSISRGFNITFWPQAPGTHKVHRSTCMHAYIHAYTQAKTSYINLYLKLHIKEKINLWWLTAVIQALGSLRQKGLLCFRGQPEVQSEALSQTEVRGRAQSSPEWFLFCPLPSLHCAVILFRCFFRFSAGVFYFFGGVFLFLQRFCFPMVACF